jgi:hypothetical protein
MQHVNGFEQHMHGAFSETGHSLIQAENNCGQRTWVRLKRAPLAFIISFVSCPAKMTSPTAHPVLRRLMPCVLK